MAPRARKKEWLVLLLAMLPGFIGFLGIGHFYLGKWGRGLVLLVVGLVVWVPALVLFVMGAGAVYFDARTALILMLSAFALMAGRMALWVWHTLDARKIYRERF
ncbi:MAG: hypothetical protein Q7T04_02415, partial [Dehalococcoidia bacterium]|nr:hypothetical protein [Dehalococcoidia bacterium]